MAGRRVRQQKTPPAVAIPSKPRSAQRVPDLRGATGGLTSGLVATIETLGGSWVWSNAAGIRRVVRLPANGSPVAGAGAPAVTLPATAEVGGSWVGGSVALADGLATGAEVMSGAEKVTCKLGSEAISQYRQADARAAPKLTSRRTRTGQGRPSFTRMCNQDSARAQLGN